MTGINKVFMGFMVAIFLMTVLNTCNSCAQNKEDVKFRKEIDSLSSQIESQYTKEEIDQKLDNITVEMQIEGLEISKRMLYDNNAIIRTTIRPDDQMAEYDRKIKELRDKQK
jgi:cell division protein FtsL